LAFRLPVPSHAGSQQPECEETSRQDLPIRGERAERSAENARVMPMLNLALSMIVKDGERDLVECLASVAGVVSELVVADTGSTDASMEIARNAGAKVFSIPWENDFAKARNLSLAQVTADWVLMLDADERLDPDAASLLRVLLANRTAAGYQVVIRNYVNNMGTNIWGRPAKVNDSTYSPARDCAGYIDHENVRLFRRDPEIYFTGRVHETVGWRILGTERKLENSQLVVHHMGMLRDAEERARKLLFYRELGKRKVQDMPENSQAHFELGVSELENFGNLHEALAAMQRSCELNSQFGVAWFFAGVCHFRLGEFPDALACFQRAERVGHTTAAAAELAGDTCYNLGDYEAAETRYRRALKRDPVSATLQSKLGLAEARGGNTRAGLRRIRNAIQCQPANAELYDRLIMVEVWLNNLSGAAESAERKLKAVPPRPEDFLRAASIRARMKEWEKAAEVLREGLLAFPGSEPLQANLCSVETLLNGTPADELRPVPNH
jgi:tetratricopeptide (TPR) repeat protein